jgi:hypothetical protein
MESSAGFFVTGNQAVKNADNAPRVTCNGFLVRNDDNRVAFF